MDEAEQMSLNVSRYIYKGNTPKYSKTELCTFMHVSYVYLSIVYDRNVSKKIQKYF